jgi:sporulation protein YlmC with PRC-barrel domain
MPLLIGFDLLDRQIVDRDGVPVGNVDDVELYEREQVRGPWIIETLARAILRRRTTTVPCGAVRWR